MRVLGFALVASVLVAGCNGGEPFPYVGPRPCGALDADYVPDERFLPTVTLDTSRGDIELVLYTQQAPISAGRFVVDAAAGLLDGTHFHQIAMDQFIVGGDPFSAADNKNLWGTGGYEETFVSEFHQFLRHDGPGMVSYVSRGPNQEGSVFLVSFTPRPDRDDQNSVFASVLSGLDAAKRIAETPVDDRGRPTFDAEIIGATIGRPLRDAIEAPITLSSFGFDCHQTVEPGQKAEFLLAVRNTGQRVMNGTFEAEAPDGWTAELRDPPLLQIPAGQTSAVILDVRPPANAEQGSLHAVTATFSDVESGAVTTLELQVEIGELGPTPKDGDKVSVHYVGVLEDGRPFDTTELALAEVPWFTWFREGGEPPAAVGLEPLPIEVGTGRIANPGVTATVVPGFQTLVDRAQIGQTVVAAIPPARAYGDESFGESNLGGRTLYFQVQLAEPV